MARSRTGERKTVGFRRKLIIQYFVLLSIALAASTVVARSILLARVDDRIQARLVKEGDEVGLFADNAPALVREAYRRHVRELFSALLAVDPPGPSESDVTFVDGEPFIRTPSAPPYELENDPGIVAAWGSLDTITTGVVDTPAGPVDFRALPVASADGSRGVYVVAVFRDLERRDVDQATVAAVIVAFAALTVGTLLAWRATGRMLRPVAAVTSAARSISESDLSRRLPVEGDKEIATLARTFNDMLDRIESAFTAQRSFLNDAGHELRTPITVIRGQLELLQDDPEQRRETIGLVTDELDRMARMVNDLVLLAKAEQPDLLRFDTVDIAQLTEELSSKVRSLNGRAWQVEAVGHGVVVADRQRLTEAMMQLAENAITHTSEGPLFLGSSVDPAEARLWVRDEGPGISLQDQERIFSRFSKEVSGPRREGAGLGLAIVRAIAEAHHGRVELSSAPGMGSTFTIAVPVDQPLPASDGDRA